MAGVISIGTDLVKISRIESSWLRWGDRFSRKILHPNELQVFSEQQNSVSFLAKRFSAKEAVAKCLGTGLGGGVHFPLIEVTREAYGRPGVLLHGRSKEIFDRAGATQILLSLSDEKDYALAFAVMSAD